LAAIRVGHKGVTGEMYAHHDIMNTNQERMMPKIDASHKRMMVHLGKMEATDLEANPEVRSKVQHEEVPKEDAAVETGKASNKWHRGWNLASKRCQTQKQQTRRNCGSRKKLTNVGRKMTHWRKRNVIKKKRTRTR
jgi:hypothetical protein